MIHQRYDWEKKECVYVSTIPHKPTWNPSLNLMSLIPPPQPTTPHLIGFSPHCSLSQSNMAYSQVLGFPSSLWCVTQLWKRMCFRLVIGIWRGFCFCFQAKIWGKGKLEDNILPAVRNGRGTKARTVSPSSKSWERTMPKMSHGDGIRGSRKSGGRAKIQRG